MPASPVKPGFGPTLPEVLGPRLRRLPRPVLAILGALVLAVLAVVVVAAAGENADLRRYVHRAAPQFNLSYAAPLRSVTPQGDELLRLEQRRADGLFVQSFAVEPLTLPPYRGQAGGELPIYAVSVGRELARRFRGYGWVEDGKTRINQVPGYVITFRAKLGDRTLYGRRYLMVPDVPGARRGVTITLLATPSAGVGGAVDVGNQGALKSALRSFRFGTEHP